ncbi:hypothetical protein WAK64_21275 [Bacillus spongiae]|uniref:DUF7674 domain-containing protein n=1 Tax=Bacillus spongiae TaxID=2683610 RepID=A0ABU8HJH1_9BACI
MVGDEMKKLVKQFVYDFPKFNDLLEEHIELNEEILPHVFFGECNEYFKEFLKKDDKEELKKLFDFFERMAIEGDDYTKEILSVTILARLGDDKDILNISYKYMREETRNFSNEIEKFWGR